MARKLKKEKVSKRTKAHQLYRKTCDNSLVPGVTTIIGVLAKPALVPWANKLGLEGIDVAKYVDDKAEIGTYGHALVMADLGAPPPDTSEYSASQISQAENALLSWYAWKKGKAIKPVLIEESIVDDELGFGGTVDLVAEIDGQLELIDLKTGKGIWPEHSIQLAAYRHLVVGLGHKPVRCRILNIPRTEDEAFDEAVVSDLEVNWQIFCHCLGIYNLRKIAKHGNLLRKGSS